MKRRIDRTEDNYSNRTNTNKRWNPSSSSQYNHSSSSSSSAWNSSDNQNSVNTTTSKDKDKDKSFTQLGYLIERLFQALINGAPLDERMLDASIRNAKRLKDENTRQRNKQERKANTTAEEEEEDTDSSSSSSSTSSSGDSGSSDSDSDSSSTTSSSSSSSGHTFSSSTSSSSSASSRRHKSSSVEKTSVVPSSTEPLVPVLPPPLASEEAKQWGLHPQLIEKLIVMEQKSKTANDTKSSSSSKINKFFPIQRQTIPYLVHSSNTLDPFNMGDICISAPTGSGKTLAYALPVIHDLLRRSDKDPHFLIPSTSLSSTNNHYLTNNPLPIRVLILLPTRDLAIQVYNIIRQLCSDTPLKVELAVGQASFIKEHEKLTVTQGCDILICTPGRLMDHLDIEFSSNKLSADTLLTSNSSAALSSSSLLPTESLSLSKLRWLIIDEADRLLAESYHGWVRKINDQVFNVPLPKGGVVYTTVHHNYDDNTPDNNTSGIRISSIVPVTNRMWKADGSKVGTVLTATAANSNEPSVLEHYQIPSTVQLLPSWYNHHSTNNKPTNSSSELTISPLPVPFRRIVCSATLTTNPQKLSALGLRQAKYFVSNAANVLASAADNNGEPNDNAKRLYTLPSTLYQSYVVCGAAEKPIVLIHLLRLLEGQHTVTSATNSASTYTGLRALVFTGSVETTHRLCRLLQLFGGLQGKVVEFSSTLSQSKRNTVLQAARNGEISVLVSSDAAARGLDLPSLPAVIHYDVATRVKTYVHRVGRVARAGRLGVTYTLAKPEQMYHFKHILERTITDHSPIKETLSGNLINSYVSRLNLVLQELQKVLEKEKNGEIQEHDTVEAITV